MEAVLTNRSRFDADTLRTAGRRSFRPRFILLMCLSILFLGGGIYSLLRYKPYFQTSPRLLLSPVIFFLGSVYYFWQACTAVNRHVKRTIRRLEESRQVSGYDCVYRFTDTEMQAESSISSDLLRFPYSSVKRLVPYRNLILVYGHTKQYFMLNQDRFENGTDEDFWKLMNEKCPKAVPTPLRRL